MKLASYQDGSRDGQLVVVSRDLTAAHYATGIATRLQQVLDDWNFMSPQLETLSQSLNHGKTRHAFAFDPARCIAPLPRAFQWMDGSGHATGDASPGVAASIVDRAHSGLRRGASDRFLSPRAAIECDERASIDVEAKLAVVLGDVAPDVAPESALDGVRLLMLAADIADRGTLAWPATAFSPVAVTPDELGAGWQGGRVQFNLEIHVNGKRFGLVAAGPGMHAAFGELISAATYRRGVSAGCILGSGPLRQDDPSRGFASLAEKRAHEQQDGGEPRTGFMKPGDTVRIDMKGATGQSLFGTIELRGVDIADHSAAADESTARSPDESAVR